MVKYIILLTVLFCQHAAAQKSYTKEYAAIDSLTKKLQTYAIEVLINDSLLPYRNIIATEVIRSFKFLGEKKMDKTNPDFIIKIKVSPALSGQPKSFYVRKEGTGTRYEGNLYQILYPYKYNVTMEVVTKNNAGFNIDVAHDKEFNTTVHKTIYDDPGEIPFLKDRRWTANDLDYFINTCAANFKGKVDLFIKDFITVIKMYKRN